MNWKLEVTSNKNKRSEESTCYLETSARIEWNSDYVVHICLKQALLRTVVFARFLSKLSLEEVKFGESIQAVKMAGLFWSPNIWNLKSNGIAIGSKILSNLLIVSATHVAENFAT